MSTDGQTPFLGTFLVPLEASARREDATAAVVRRGGSEEFMA